MKKIQEWVKNNQTLAISAGISLVLIGGAVYYLMHGISVNGAMTEQLATTRAELEGLQTETPFPNQANVKAMKEETEKLKELSKEFGTKFAPIPVPEDTYTDRGFHSELESMVADLNKKAKDASIQLPTNRVNFSYAFSAQRSNLRMDTNSLKIQAEQLAHVKYLCNTVMDSGISEFIRIRRAAGTSNDLMQVGNYLADYLPARKIITNKFSFSYPYELVFKTSPGDLGKFINTLEQSPYGLMIKCVKVERAASEMTDELANYQENLPVMAGRYGRMGGPRGGRVGGPGMMPVPQQQVEAKTAAEEEIEKALPKVTTTVLKPTALRVTMYVDFVRLKDDEEIKTTGTSDQPQGETYDLDGDGTKDIDAEGNTLPGASVDQNGNPVGGAAATQATP